MSDYSHVQAARQRELISTLDEKLDYIKNRFADKVLVDQHGTSPDGSDITILKGRTVQWVIGSQEFHFTYTEAAESPGSATFRVRWRTFKGENPDWFDLGSLGGLDGQIRNAVKTRGPRAGDAKAARNSHKHDGPTPENLLLVGLTGSHAYGLATPESDVDTRGIFAVKTKQLLSLGGAKAFVENKATDTKFDEVERFFELCLNCNPERLEMLAHARASNPIVTVPDTAMCDEHLAPGPNQLRALVGPYGQQILAIQDLFLSRAIIKTYGGYAKQQLYRIEAKEERTFKPRMHLIRLMLTGIKALETGKVDPDMSAYRDRLLAIKRGETELSEVTAWHNELEARFAEAANNTALPATNDAGREAANELLLEIRRAFLTW